MKKFTSYYDYIVKLYRDDSIQNYDNLIRNITFQVTDSCNMACSYCYEKHKGNRMMTKETAKKGIDLLFKMWDDNIEDAFINQNTKGLILEFIGGEPFLNIDIIDYTCNYFAEECIKRHHPWGQTWRISIISNGSLYFKPEVQHFLKEFQNFLSFSITLDGPKEIHDTCRVYHNGKGNFEDAYKAIQHYKANFNKELGTKVTIAPENLKDLNKIVKFFVDEGFSFIPANPVFETEWNLTHAKQYYQELIKMADYLLSLNDDIEISLFDEWIGHPLPETENQNWCGGNMRMLAFDPDGKAYPCLRYMESSLNKNVEPIIIGGINGLFQTEKQQSIANCLSCITRRSQSTDECFYCPVASGCAWCSAWNYEYFGELNKRCTNICLMHKARVAANYYYWNKYYALHNEDKEYELNLSKEDYENITGLEYPQK